ncbi:MAG TPA: ABC transporter ATP-binding protein [Aigarchaeota archaeon]|nr:ABC transporter ATP-binding protein [Aigarchaeota archaeon]
MTLLECRNITKRFGGITALNNVNLSIDEEEVVGLIGPNGSGKTTMTNIVSGVYRPDQGKVMFNGREVTNLPPDKRFKMGIVRTFQIPQPFHSLTVLDNVLVALTFGCRNVDSGSRRREAFDILEFVGLADKAEHYPASLNVVELKKMELARALAGGAKLLILDEINAGLNPAEVGHAIELIRKIHKSGVSLLVIEHVMKVILTLCERVVVLNFGHKIAEGTPEEIRSDELVIKAYLGEEYRIRR